MAIRIDWSPEAIDDIKSIAEYIERDSPFYARAVVNSIFQSVEKLSEFPGIGRIVPELGREEIREIIAYSYRVVYKIEKKRILVVAIIHSKRNFKEALDNRIK